MDTCCQMASAAGLLSQIGDAAYSATKHAAVGFAESLAISHADQGIKVSVICPQYVATPMLGYGDAAEAEDLPDVLTPDQVAEAVIEGVGREAFLILPHPQVARFIQFKSADYERWLGAMRTLRTRIVETRIRFKRLSRREIEAYIASREWRGKAGGYAIQGLAGCFVQKIIGSYTNVVGLPLTEVSGLLAGEGFMLHSEWGSAAAVEA